MLERFYPVFFERQTSLLMTPFSIRMRTNLRALLQSRRSLVTCVRGEISQNNGLRRLPTEFYSSCSSSVFKVAFAASVRVLVRDIRDMYIYTEYIVYTFISYRLIILIPYENGFQTSHRKKDDIER